MKTFIVLSPIISIFIVLQAFMPAPNDPWPVPEKYEVMKNPVKSDANSIANGNSLWGKHCQSCHGKTGKGDGPKASQLATDSGDFTQDAFKKQSDGALFYKTITGRKDMPSYKRKIPDESEIWSIVNYMRTFK